MGAGYFFALCHYGLLYSAVFRGLGTSTQVLMLEEASRFYFMSRVFLMLALLSCKASVLVFTRRIFSGNLNKERFFFGSGYMLVGIWGVAAVLLSSAGCDPNESLVAEENAVCSANATRWKTITALDVVTELVLLALPVGYVSLNRIRAAEKRIAVLAFSFRLIVAALSIAAMESYFHFLRGMHDSIGLAPAVAWQESVLAISFITASLPGMQSFLRSFMSRGLQTTYGNTSSATSRRNRSIRLESIHNTNPFRYKVEVNGAAHPKPFSTLRPDQAEFKVDIGNPADERMIDSSEGQSIRSEGSQDMIIRRHIEVEVYEERC
ncbi:hypothetical protein LTR86_011012 [Recurvomyces mirabilis]|nr:hypothetical protein LTR86_011012 [Recurvomyces mirabilis]